MGSGLQKHNKMCMSEIYQFGRIQVCQDFYGYQCFKQIYNFAIDPNAKQQFIQHLRNKNNKCPYLIQIKDIRISQESLCSNSVKIIIVFQYLSTTLKTLIDKKHPFTQQQIVRLFHNLLSAVRYLNENQSYHGDVCPQFIYIDSKSYNDYLFKVFDSAYFVPSSKGYYRAQKQKTYCAPEILSNLSQNKVYPLYNYHTADTFSIGLVVLECMTLINPLAAYTKKYQIDFYYIQSMLRIAERKGFTEYLICLIRECLQIKIRPTVGEMLSKLEKLNLIERYNIRSPKMSLKKKNNFQIPTLFN